MPLNAAINLRDPAVNVRHAKKCEPKPLSGNCVRGDLQDLCAEEGCSAVLSVLQAGSAVLHDARAAFRCVCTAGCDGLLAVPQHHAGRSCQDAVPHPIIRS